jgi:hypothetical protein
MSHLLIFHACGDIIAGEELQKLDVCLRVGMDFYCVTPAAT